MLKKLMIEKITNSGTFFFLSKAIYLDMICEKKIKLEGKILRHKITCLFRNGKWEKLFIKALNQTAFEGVTVGNI